MGKLIDLTGQVFGRLTVLQRAENTTKSRGSRWLCKCTCGNFISVASTHLRDGHVKSCGCLNREMASERFLKDLTGKQFGRLTVLYRAENGSGNHARWHCKCSCGQETDVWSTSLIEGTTISCGCYQKEHRHDKMIDLTGKRFGRLVVTGFGGIRSHGTLWHTKCDCGICHDVLYGALVSGQTKSCGCYAKEQTSKRSLIDLTGQQFGFLKVIEKDASSKSKIPMWRCLCENCGRETVVRSSALRGGAQISCGCIKSKTELLIAEFLDKYNIVYEKNKKFIGCKDKRSLYFDFWLSSYGICLEFDGAQHYKEVPYWDKKYDLSDRQRRDAIKTKYCEENDIILLRIPYWEKDNIESILSDWLFLNEDERNDDDENICKTAG